MFKYLIVIICVLQFLSCENTKKVIKNKVNSTKVLADSHSNVEAQKQIIIKTQEELNGIYATLNQTRQPGYKVPAINFEKEIVVALFMGLKTSGGYQIKIDSILQHKKSLIIYYTETYPTGMASSVITHPFYIAKINKTDMPILFVKK